MLHSLPSSQSKEGPEASQVTSVRYLELAHGCVLCVSSTNGTQIYNEDATTLLFFAPISDPTGSPGIQKCHQAACVVAPFQHIIIGTSEGSLILVQAAACDKYVAMPDSAPATGAATEVTDICYCAAAQSVFSAHTNGEIRIWQPAQSGPYTNVATMAGSGQSPVAISSLGARLLVVYGPGTICLYDAISPEHELQVEISAHARWINGCAVREDQGLVATVGEDTVLNVWQVDPNTGRVGVHHSSVVTDKLLTGCVFYGSMACVTAYDSDDLYSVPI